MLTPSHKHFVLQMPEIAFARSMSGEHPFLDMDLVNMAEIQVDVSETGRSIFINGVPDLQQVPQDIMDCFAEKLLEMILERLMSLCFQVIQKKIK